jgi:hypothetical protein
MWWLSGVLQKIPIKYARVGRKNRDGTVSVTWLYYTLHVGIHILIFFLAHLAKGKVGIWYPSFVVCHLLIFHILILSSETHQPNELKKKWTNQKQELPVAAMFVNRSEWNEQSLQNTFHRCFLPSFGSFGQEVSEEKLF